MSFIRLNQNQKQKIPFVLTIKECAFVTLVDNIEYYTGSNTIENPPKKCVKISLLP